MKMKNIEYRKRSKQKSEIEKIYERLKVIQQNSVLMEYIEKEYVIDGTRVEVLRSILIQMENGTIGEMENEIYLYGSLIKGQDLMARQVFLWLLQALEESRAI